MTTTHTPQTTLDEARVEQFAGRLLTDLAGAATIAMTAIGDRLGLYRALADSGARTAEQFAADTGLEPRLLTEWLAAQTVAGYVADDPENGTYEVPAEHAMVLSEADSPAFRVPAADLIAAQYLMLERLEEALRGDGAIDWADWPSATAAQVQRFFRTAYIHELRTTWFPAVPGLVERLEAGVRVADVGCGHGLSTLLMGAHWPASTFVGVDFDKPSIAAAHANAVEAGGRPNVSFLVGDATEPFSGEYDVVVYFDALHDMGDPASALREAYASLCQVGIVLAIEPWSTDRLEDGIGNPLVQLDYALSTSVCTPCALAQQGRHAMGNQGGPTARLELLTAAGFRDPIVAADTGFNLVLAATK